jgi:hypothetical protein
MEPINFKEMQKKNHRIGIKLSKVERDRLFQFCQKKGVTVSELIRQSFLKVINEKNSK